MNRNLSDRELRGQRRELEKISIHNASFSAALHEEPVGRIDMIVGMVPLEFPGLVRKLRPFPRFT